MQRKGTFIRTTMSTMVNSAKILIVEDEPIIGLDIQKNLIGLGYDVPLILSSGEEAINAIEEIRPDLLLIGINLAGDIDGIEAVSEIKKKTALPVIYLTAQTDQDTFFRAQETEPYGFIVKPVLKNDLHTAIQMALNRYELENRLRDTENRYRSLFESPLNIIFMYTPEGDFIDANDAAFAITGYNLEELSQLNFAAICDAEHLEKVTESIVELIDTGMHREPVEIKLQCKDRSSVWIEFISTLIYREGKPFRIQSIARDITDRRKAEEALRTEKERTQQYLDIAGAIIVVLDREGTVSLINKMGAKVLGLSEKEIIGKSWIDHFIPENERRKIREPFTRIMRGEVDPNIHYENAVLTRDGEERVITWSNSIIRDTTGAITALISSGVDITDRKRAEEEIQSTISKLRKAMNGIIQAMTLTIEARDPYTAGHQRKVSNLARAIASELKLPQEKIDGIRMAGLIHDIGKINIPAQILTKPGTLTDIEFDFIKSHPKIGYDILRTIEFPWPVADIVYQHHERLDGSGYPEGLSGDDIMIEARIMSVADVVEAMASHRPYRPAIGIAQALEEITKYSGIKYDADAVTACIRLFREKGFSLEIGPEGMINEYPE